MKKLIDVEELKRSVMPRKKYCTKSIIIGIVAIVAIAGIVACVIAYLEEKADSDFFDEFDDFDDDFDDDAIYARESDFE